MKPELLYRSFIPKTAEAQDVQLVGAYLYELNSLTLKETSQPGIPKVISENPNYSVLFSPLLMYGSIIVFIVVLTIALGLQFIQHSLNRRRIAAALFIAFIASSVPLGIRLSLETTRLSIRASSDDVPQNLRIQALSDSTVLINWETKANKTGLVRIGSAPLTDNYGQTIIADNAQKTHMHSVTLERLESGQLYQIEILSGNKWYNDNGRPIEFVFANR